MKSIAVIFLFFIFSSAYCAEFVEYQYSKYLGIQQQLQARKMMAYRQNLRYRQNPTRNIRYPSYNNPYPNIQKGRYPNTISARQRYSPSYYQRYYR